MPVRTGGGLETVSLVLTTEQVRRLRALVALRSSDVRRVSLSDVAREVVEAGLGAVLLAPVSDLTASGHKGGGERAA